MEKDPQPFLATTPACKKLHQYAGKNRHFRFFRSFRIAIKAWQSSCKGNKGHASPWIQDMKRITMSRKQSKYRHIILFESRRGRLMTETPEPTPQEPIPKRSPDRPPATIPQPLVPHPGSDPLPPGTAPDPGPAPFVMRGRLLDASETTLPPYARRRFRGWIVTRFDVRRVQRMIPIKSENFRLRYRNLSYKRKWNLVWC
jgi:hypothetical protein